MGTFAKIRNLGQYGIISDQDPYDLPPNAFSAGVNVRFRNGHVSRAPVWKDIFPVALDSSGPRWVVSDTFGSGQDDIFVCYLDGKVYLTTPSLETDYSAPGWAASDQEIPWTNCHLANVCYVNRGDRAPWYFIDSASQFQTLPNWALIDTSAFTGSTTSGSPTVSSVSTVIAGYFPIAVGQTITGPGIPAGTTITAIGTGTLTLSVNATATATGVSLISGTQQTWAAGLLRTVGGTLVALNLTINGVNYPTTLATSSFALANNPPTSWDYAVIDTSATQNTLADLEGGILDACTLGNNLVIYGFNSSWLMVPTTGTEIFDYVKLPYNKGALNANCSVEIDGRNYVFGPDDIWVHDGTTEKSLVTDRNRDYIFSNLNFSAVERCFVGFNPALREIYFCYQSNDALVNFGSVGGANRAAVYNYADDTWSFDDLPSVYGAAYANTNASQTWASITSTWATVGGAWNSQDQNAQRTSIWVGDTQSAYGLTQHLYGYDLFGLGSTAAFTVDLNATAGAQLHRDGIDLDQIQGIDLPDYKLFSSLFPLGRIDANANTALEFDFGTSDFYGQAAIFDGVAQTYDGAALYKLDYNMQGRFASLKIKYNDYTTFSLSGLDLLVDETGQR
jgi:hypothetical protein